MENNKQEAALVVAKDLGIEILERDYSSLTNLLARKINELIDKDFARLVQILYRMDIDEQKLKSLLSAFPEEDAGRMIAQLMIERQEQKIKNRYQNKGNSDIPGEDRW